MEASVQIWWKCAIVVAIVMTYVTTVQVQGHLAEQRLLEKGVLVNARVVQLGDRTIKTGAYRPARDNDLYVKLDGFPDGLTHEGTLPKGDGFAELGGMLQLRVDPKNPDRWVEVRPQSEFVHELMAVFLLLPVIILLLAIAQWRRRAVLKVWRLGELQTGVIASSRHSSTAPRSRICRYTIAGSNDRRVFSMLHPNRHGLLREGDALNMIALPGEPERAIVADLYLDPADGVVSGGASSDEATANLVI
jgi:hypothetical protein